MSNETRGKAIHDRRMALGHSEASFARATGIDRGALRRAEAGTASARTYERLEVWLDREEKRTDTVPSVEAGMVELDLTIEPGARAVIRGPVADLARLRHELVELVREVRAEIKQDDQPAGQ